MRSNLLNRANVFKAEADLVIDELIEEIEKLERMTQEAVNAVGIVQQEKRMLEREIKSLRLILETLENKQLEE